jgi:hypothetical protein
MEAIFRPEIVEIFSDGFLLPQNHRHYPETAVSGPDCST